MVVMHHQKDLRGCYLKLVIATTYKVFYDLGMEIAIVLADGMGGIDGRISRIYRR